MRSFRKILSLTLALSIVMSSTLVVFFRVVADDLLPYLAGTEKPLQEELLEEEPLGQEEYEETEPRLVEKILNGSFVSITTNGSPTSWTLEKGAVLAEPDLHTGERYLMMKSSSELVLATQKVAIVSGAVHYLSSDLKVVKGKGSLKVEFYDRFDKFIDQQDVETFAGEGDDWVEVNYSPFTAPDNATTALVCLRMAGGGEIYWFNVSLMQEPVFDKIEVDAETEGVLQRIEDLKKAGAINLVRNGSFEKSDYYYQAGWIENTPVTIDNTAIGKSCVKDGENSLMVNMFRTNTASTAYRTGGRVEGLIPGNEYIVAAWYYAERMGISPSPEVHLAMYKTLVNYDYWGAQTVYSAANLISDIATKSLTKEGEGKWQLISLKFVAESETATVTIGGNFNRSIVYFDDIQVVGHGIDYPDTSFDYSYAAPWPRSYGNPKSPMKGEENLVKNGKFEKLINGYPAGWSRSGGQDSQTAMMAKDPERGSVMRLTSGGSISQMVTGLKPGYEYTFTVWYKTEEKFQTRFNSGARFYNEWFNEHGDYAGGGYDSPTRSFPYTDGEWKQVFVQRYVPLGIYSTAVRIQVFDCGPIYFTDFQIYCSGMPKRVQLNTHTALFYAEQDYGTAYADWNSNFYGNETFAPEDTISFALKDSRDGNVLHHKEYPMDRETIEYRWPLSLMEWSKEYWVQIEHRDVDGNILQSLARQVFKYNRPKRLDEYGNHLNTKGEVIHPVIGWSGVGIHILDQLEGTGINVLHNPRMAADQPTYNNDPPEKTLAILDAAWDRGFYCTIVKNLGRFSYSWNNPEGFKYYKEFFEKVKDHPGLFSVSTWDEASVRNIPESDEETGDIDRYYEWVLQMTRMHKMVDEDLPVVSMMSGSNSNGGRVTDIAEIDPYCYWRDNQMLLKSISAAQRSYRFTKPVTVLLQAFAYGHIDPNTGLPYIPSAMHMRQQIYTSFFSKANMFGYYAVVAYDRDLNVDLWDRALFKDPGGLKDFVKDEQDDAFAVFVDGKYPIFNEHIPDPNYVENLGIWYTSYVKDGELYVVVQNTKPWPAFPVVDGEPRDEIEVPLTSYDGLISIGDFTAYPAAVHAGHIDENGYEPPIKGSGSLKLTLKGANDVLRYRIVPDKKVDYSNLTASIYYDLLEYPWAKKQIDELANLGMVNAIAGRQFLPGNNIIRADFALFLMRALGLTSGDVKKNPFSDVDKNAYYAKEVAAGKALGIFTGNNKKQFDPLEEISRQDAMVMVARAMRAAEKLGKDGNAGELNAFTDKNLISDYALDDISAIVGAGIVKGDATNNRINPRGLMTRAEAAVLVYRVMKSK